MSARSSRQNTLAVEENILFKERGGFMGKKKLRSGADDFILFTKIVKIKRGGFQRIGVNVHRDDSKN